MIISRNKLVIPEVKDRAKEWLTAVLLSPTLTHDVMPASLGCGGYIDGRWITFVGGTWEYNGSIVYLAGSSHSQSLTPLTKVGVLTLIAAVHGVTNEPEISDAITKAVVKNVTESLESIHHALIESVVAPSHMALHAPTARFAAKLGDIWMLPNGNPVTVDNSWLVMEC